jgi:hypothetical protein
VRVDRLTRSVSRWRQLTADITAVEADMARLLALTDGQILTTLPGVKDVRAACFSAFSLPIKRFPTAEHLYSATGLAPASYKSSSIDRRSGISRQGLPEHRDALMGIAWGLSQHCPPFTEERSSYAPEGCARCRSASRSPATPAGRPIGCSPPKTPSTNSATVRKSKIIRRVKDPLLKERG